MSAPHKPLNFVDLDAAIVAANKFAEESKFPGFRYQPGDMVDLGRWDRYQRKDHDESIYPYDPFGICRVISSRRACSQSGAMTTVENERRRRIELDQDWMEILIEV